MFTWIIRERREKTAFLTDFLSRFEQMHILLFQTMNDPPNVGEDTLNVSNQNLPDGCCHLKRLCQTTLIKTNDDSICEYVLYVLSHYCIICLFQVVALYSIRPIVVRKSCCVGVFQWNVCFWISLFSFLTLGTRLFVHVTQRFVCWTINSMAAFFTRWLFNRRHAFTLTIFEL